MKYFFYKYYNKWFKCVALLYATFQSPMLLAQKVKVCNDKQTNNITGPLWVKKKKKRSCFGLFHYFRWWCKHDYYRCKPHFFPQLKTVLGHCVIVLRCTILQYLSIIANQGRIYCSTYTNVAVIWCRTRHRISSVLGPWLDRQVVSCVMKHSPWLT